MLSPRFGWPRAPLVRRITRKSCQFVISGTGSLKSTVHKESRHDSHQTRLSGEIAMAYDPHHRPTALVIFGGGGDLTWRKLVPALFNLHSGQEPAAAVCPARAGPGGNQHGDAAGAAPRRGEPLRPPWPARRCGLGPLRVGGDVPAGRLRRSGGLRPVVATTWPRSMPSGTPRPIASSIWPRRRRCLA